MLWIVAIAVGSAATMRYDTAPGVAAEPPAHWPVDTALARAAGRHTLVMLVHPRCPCSHASLEALDRLLARVEAPPRIHLLFVAPPDVASDWERTDLWMRATRLPHVEVVRDDRGREASRFATVTSGQTLLYDREGRLVFSGGLTPSRGHAGDSAGWDAVHAALVHAQPTRPDAPVFGCPLVDPPPPSERPGAL